MKNDEIKTTIFKKGLKAIPNFIWVFCASYALIMVTNLFVLNFAHIDADKHINRYLDILLTEKENKHSYSKEFEELKAQVQRNTELSHGEGKPTPKE